MNKLASFLLSAALVTVPVSALAQYKGGDVKDGGSVSGTVKFKGTAPAPKKLDVGKDKEVCDKSPKTDPTLIVSNGNLANAVITITDIKSGKKMDGKKVTLDQKGLRISSACAGFPGRDARGNFEPGRNSAQHSLVQQGEQPV